MVPVVPPEYGLPLDAAPLVVAQGTALMIVLAITVVGALLCLAAGLLAERHSAPPFERQVRCPRDGRMATLRLVRSDRATCATVLRCSLMGTRPSCERLCAVTA
jgi:hypothetical protein